MEAAHYLWTMLLMRIYEVLPPYYVRNVAVVEGEKFQGIRRKSRRDGVSSIDSRMSEEQISTRNSVEIPILSYWFTYAKKN